MLRLTVLLYRRQESRPSNAPKRVFVLEGVICVIRGVVYNWRITQKRTSLVLPTKSAFARAVKTASHGSINHVRT